MTHASLFSGIGGAELAASWMGWQNLFHCEIQEFQRKVLEYWFPNSISYEDITKTDFKAWRGKVDILTSGFPCQPYSVAGNRLGAGDDRALWPQMLRAVREIQPAWVVGENVAGILSMVQPGETVKVGRADDLFEENYLYRAEQQFTLEAICQDLERAGYAVQPFVVPACAVGAPHQRDRVWIVAHRTDAGPESVQQGWPDGVRGFGPAARADSNRPRQREDKQVIERECKRAADVGNGCKNRPVANAKCHGGNEVGNEVQPGQSNGKRADSNGLLGTSADTDGQRRLTLGDDNASVEEPQQAKCKLGGADCPQGWWRNFPTVAPVCRGNDGLPFRVADLAISFPKWRAKSIEALGNSWVPQVAYEIFKAIENSNIKH